MRSKSLTLLLVVAVAFLIATNPSVSDAARMITGNQIKNGSVTGQDIKDHSLTSADVSGSIAGPVGPAGQPGQPGAPATRLWATVATGSTPTLPRSSGATGVTRGGTGDYVVTFNQPVGACTYLSTVSDTNAGVAPNLYSTVERTSTSSVEVRILDATGAQVDPATTGDGFDVAVFC